MGIYYWNCSDNRDHKHQRIEWSISNEYLICYNIRIDDKLFENISIGDIILAYEPKTHKISKYNNGEDGFCIDCSNTRHDGRQAFTNAFICKSKPMKISNLESYELVRMILYRSWYSENKHCRDYSSDKEYFTQYFKKNNFIYMIPIKWSGLLPYEISTNKKGDAKYIYYGKIIRGFDIFNDPYLECYITNLESIRNTKRDVALLNGNDIF